MTYGITPPERQIDLRLPDGRVFAWSEWGPQNGRPVVFCTGAAMSGALGFGAGVLSALDVRLIVPDRPGLGRSDPHPKKTLLSWVADVRCLLHTARLGDARVVGFSQGAPFALALAGADLVGAAALVSPQDDLRHPALTPLLSPDVANMVSAIATDPDGFEAAFADFATAGGLWELILGMSGERDRAVYLDPTFHAAYRQALAEGFARGARPYARDLVNALAPWPYEPEEMRIPVDLWFGGQDASTVHSPDFGMTLASRLPYATRVLDANEGASILWTRAYEILQALLAHTP
ncbi:alpha/beta fold hydrolase [Deinococcus hopiensis]|uniref:Pimeloyl-ACP methyl ester carboxylesterase n=1 Tax=Deinococcus hopiensis KR-140 TaxID=695939 RepID=A0A1W1VUE5_9DEIO|nr:alpha/beta hydrolase [Deinococcus hopiensis]SMB97002.1 Pimeloyl-ACP methyl ester carboxylesterase [Deinococcus hopiensis KR-140]